MSRDFSALEEAFNGTAAAERVQRDILALQARLKRKLDGSGWRIYLALEEALNDRQARLFGYLYERLRTGREEARSRSTLD